LSIPSSAVGGDFPGTQPPRPEERKRGHSNIANVFLGHPLGHQDKRKKNLLFNPFRLLTAKKNFVTFVVLVVTNAAETSDSHEADVEFFGAAWFTCFSEIE
jgi:hypothetical protein